MWCTRYEWFGYRNDNLYEKLESLSKEPALNIGTKWFETGLTKIKDGELVDNDCRLSIFYDDKKIEVMFKSEIIGVTGTATLPA